MDDDQQFCLRWNNHQSTLVSVFDNLLENSALVDCTLFAEGKYLKAHKVVLSACSPYFETLLTQQYDKHPIFILKDVKYQELKAMMDYMYRGEVNISQDQLAALLKAAESLQIKGLSDSRNKEESRKSAQPPAAAKTPPPATTPALPRVQGLTIEQRKAPKLSESLEDSRSREGSSSPVPRKRKKPRRRASQEGVNDNHDASSSSESHSNQAPVNIPSLPAVPLASTSKLTDVPEPVETKPEPVRPKMAAESSQVPIKEKQEIHSELILEPKSEYIEEEMNEDSVEDLTLDDDDVSQMEQEMDHARPGPSHGSGDGSAQGFGGWHMQGNQNQDEVFLAAQEAVGAHRDSQDSKTIEDEQSPNKSKVIMSRPKYRLLESNQHIKSTRTEKNKIELQEASTEESKNASINIDTEKLAESISSRLEEIKSLESSESSKRKAPNPLAKKPIELITPLLISEKTTDKSCATYLSQTGETTIEDKEVEHENEEVAVGEISASTEDVKSKEETVIPDRKRSRIMPKRALSLEKDEKKRCIEIPRISSRLFEKKQRAARGTVNVHRTSKVESKIRNVKNKIIKSSRQSPLEQHTVRQYPGASAKKGILMSVPTPMKKTQKATSTESTITTAAAQSTNIDEAKRQKDKDTTEKSRKQSTAAEKAHTTSESSADSEQETSTSGSDESSKDSCDQNESDPSASSSTESSRILDKEEGSSETKNTYEEISESCTEKQNLELRISPYSEINLKETVKPLNSPVIRDDVIFGDISFCAQEDDLAIQKIRDSSKNVLSNSQNNELANSVASSQLETQTTHDHYLSIAQKIAVSVIESCSVTSKRSKQKLCRLQSGPKQRSRTPETISLVPKTIPPMRSDSAPPTIISSTPQDRTFDTLSTSEKSRSPISETILPIPEINTPIRTPETLETQLLIGNTVSISTKKFEELFTPHNEFLIAPKTNSPKKVDDKNQNEPVALVEDTSKSSTSANKDIYADVASSTDEEEEERVPLPVKSTQFVPEVLIKLEIGEEDGDATDEEQYKWTGSDEDCRIISPTNSDPIINIDDENDDDSKSSQINVPEKSGDDKEGNSAEISSISSLKVQNIQCNVCERMFTSQMNYNIHKLLENKFRK